MTSPIEFLRLLRKVWTPNKLFFQKKFVRKLKNCLKPLIGWCLNVFWPYFLNEWRFCIQIFENSVFFDTLHEYNNFFHIVDCWVLAPADTSNSMLAETASYANDNMPSSSIGSCFHPHSHRTLWVNIHWIQNDIKWHHTSNRRRASPVDRAV